MKKRALLGLLLCSWALVSVAQIPPISHIDANNVRGVVLGDGTAFLNWPENNGSLLPNPCPTWEVPAGSGKTTLFQKALWIGATDMESQLHLAAMRYGQGASVMGGGQDFWSGPLINGYGSTDMMTVLKYHHIWDLTRSEIEQFKTDFSNPSYQIPDDILTWPAHGEGDNAPDMAPFVDVNGDGRYNPVDGDYPDIKGDHCLFFIFNDNYKQHTESCGAPLGVEIQAMVYAFEAPDDEALNNTVFTHYKLINRSSVSYFNVYLGLWYDWDLGYSRDDYVGCDVQRNSCYAYNGREIDGNGEPEAYGDNWPVQVTTILSGPEGLGMTGFVYHNNDVSPTGDPQYASDFYNLLRGCWKDGTHMQYGGNGYPGSNGVVGPDCNYMFPGDSDPDNIGTNGIAPNDGYNTNGKFWTDPEAGNQPDDRRGLASVGPFDFPYGSVRELDFAEITVWKNGNASAMERRGEFIDHIITFFNNLK